MSAIEVIQTTVEHAARRRRWQRALQGFWRGLLAGGLLWLAALILFKLAPVPFEILPVAGMGALLVAVGAAVAGWWRKDTTLVTARWLEQKQHLKERLSTALELAPASGNSEWSELLVGDAAQHLAGTDVRRLVPFRLPQFTRWVLLVLTLAAGLGFVPEYRSKDFIEKQREKEIVKDVGRHLADLTKRTLEHRAPALESTKQTVQSVGELGDQLTRNPLTRSEALHDLAKMTDKVAQEQKEVFTRNPALKSMERAARSAGKNSAASAEELQKQIEAMQKSLGKDATPDALEKLRNELQKAQQAASGLHGKESKAGDPERDSLAKSLSSLAKQSQDLGAMLPSLEEAMAALEAGKIDQVLKDLQTADQDLEKLKDMAQAMQQMQQQAEKMGKDLAEQLENGQAEAAQATLKKMANDLKAGTLPPEKLDAVMKELSKALGPASPYGKVPDHLKQALKQLQLKQNPEAGQSLAAAAKELEKLMQEMADAQDLKSTMDALKKAQFAVGNGQCWGTGLSKGAPRGGKGGKPGKGVGTWADEDSGWTDVPEPTEQWDNSNVERPDMASKGQSDRGDGDLPDGLVPTKVKGQMSPGNQMPSITLKGVSIKGQSKVAVQEAITAAQSEAQSALNHDQVPRAYQGAVKDYFDDLKK